MSAHGRVLPPVAAAFAAQGIGYATVVTALPAMKARAGIDDVVVSALLLGTCLAAALGSALADVIAVRRGSRAALRTGLVLQAAGLAAAALAPGLGVLAPAVAVYGIGLGAVDAATNMQGSLAQERAGRPVFGRLYAAYTAAAIAATLLAAALLGLDAPAGLTLLIAAALQLAVAVVAGRSLDPTRAARPAAAARDERPPLPGAGIWAVGTVVLVAFAVDSAVATWSTIYLADGLRAAPALTPLGYAVYLAVVLVARLSADPLVRRHGRTPIAGAAVVLSTAGCALVATWHAVPGALLGFAAAGAAAGLLVPLAFARAGELLPPRADEVIARVNVFTYAGALLGAVLLGIIAAGETLGPAFAIPAVGVLAVLPLVRALRRRPLPDPVAPA